LITIQVSGIEKLLSIVEGLRPGKIRIDIVIPIIERELDKFIQIIRQDPNIPKEYKDAIITWTNKAIGEVYLAVYIPEKLKWKKFGPYMVWKKYKCPIRKYWGGELTLKYTGPDYLMELWREHKANIIKNIKDEILSYVRSIIR